MLKGKWKILICIALVTCVIFTASNNVFAAINEDYYNNNVVGDEVVDIDIENKVGSSLILDALGSFIYSVGSLIELILGKVFQLITGSNMFPWADAILFNAVPFLDVNIFTASSNSLVSILYDFLTGTYYSLLTLASTFFGIAVMFSAIKLAITAIAEDKAKYKKAIVDWILGLVMLWGIHFFISFVLYLNEQLVIVASNIAATEIANNGDSLQIEYSEEDDIQAVEDFIDAMKSPHITDFLVLGLNRIGDLLTTGNFQYSVEESEQILRQNPRLARILLQDSRFTDYSFGEYKWYTTDAADSDKFWTWKAGDINFIQVVAQNLMFIKNKSYDDLDSLYQSLASKKDKTDGEIVTANFYKLVRDLHKSEVENEGLSNNNAVVRNLAKYFKEYAWTRETGAWRSNKVSIQNAIMYVIFVCYSLVFFISYTKRLFYVIMLILMAPIVVVFDFFMKFGK